MWCMDVPGEAGEQERAQVFGGVDYDFQCETQRGWSLYRGIWHAQALCITRSSFSVWKEMLIRTSHFSYLFLGPK